jgi:hypothetical protein
MGGFLSRGRAGALVVVAIVAGLLIGHAPAAHALIICDNTTVDCPKASGDVYTTTINKTLSVAAPGVLANDRGPTGTTVDVEDSDTESANGAIVTVHPNGSFTYDPDENLPFAGLDSFDYWIQDTDGNFDYTTVYVRVNAAPKNDTYYTPMNHTLTVAAPGVFTNDLGMSGEVIGYTAKTAHGQVALDDDGGFVYKPTTGFNGIDHFDYTGLNINEDDFFSATATIYVDSAPPIVTVKLPGKTALDTKFTVNWSGTDISGILNYDVQSETAAYNGDFGNWSNFRTTTTSTSGTFSGSPGHTYCLRARARDHAGNTSSFTSPVCIAVPLKASNLNLAGTWTSPSSSAYYGGGARISTQFGATATRTGTHVERIALVVTKCPGCGTVQVRFNGFPVANLDLNRSSGVAHKAVMVATTFDSVRTGDVQIVVTSVNKPVTIEGLAIYRD